VRTNDVARREGTDLAEAIREGMTVRDDSCERRSAALAPGPRVVEVIRRQGRDDVAGERRQMTPE